MKYTVISLFDGMSCGQIALNNLGVSYDRYFASEVDKYAISVTQHNYHNTIQIGDVSKLVVKKLRSGVILISEFGDRYFIPGNIILHGGSPCQGFSFAGKQKGASTKCKIDITTLEQYLTLKDEGFEFEGQSYLFWEYVRILRIVKPDVFLLENVIMAKKWLNMFNDAIGVQPIKINSALVSAQNRNRFYWTNIVGIEQPKDEGIVIADILEDTVDEKYYLSDDVISKYFNFINNDVQYDNECIDMNKRIDKYKTGTLPQRYYKGIENYGSSPFIICNINPSGKGMNGRVMNINDKSTTLTTNKGEGSKILIVPENTKQGYTVINDGECFDYGQPNSKTRRGRNVSKKSNCLLTSNQYMRFEYPRVRKLTPTECERLQTVPNGYTSIVSNSQRYKMLGNGWTIKVIEHIYKSL